jgi:hypothetical protein
MRGIPTVDMEISEYRMQIPTSLAIALWLTGTMWLVGLLAYRFNQPPAVVSGISLWA